MASHDDEWEWKDAERCVRLYTGMGEHEWADRQRVRARYYQLRTERKGHQWVGAGPRRCDTPAHTRYAPVQPYRRPAEFQGVRSS